MVGVFGLCVSGSVLSEGGGLFRTREKPEVSSVVELEVKRWPSVVQRMLSAHRRAVIYMVRCVDQQSFKDLASSPFPRVLPVSSY